MMIGYVAEKLVPFDMPGGFFGSILAGFIGAWIGHGLLGTWGPAIAGFYLIPALIGAVIIVVVAGLIAKLF
ncbi:GlsB/YeaQ/YmgE family stress response membrane protein [Bacillus tuaregi]|uniref:GlsB/YeaQ/YmgE family stress response membrane protein n=1 Tax=Bacillus tuaregi TaxID=1816695 RepID=UPI0008F96DC4|nr:GlsB/YeaQ/YmgE family stress response membrane protein [Bacillus tuaregi]